MVNKTRKKMRIIWIIISVLGIIGMVGFTMIPLFQSM